MSKTTKSDCANCTHLKLTCNEDACYLVCEYHLNIYSTANCENFSPIEHHDR